MSSPSTTSRPRLLPTEWAWYRWGLNVLSTVRRVMLDGAGPAITGDFGVAVSHAELNHAGKTFNGEWMAYLRELGLFGVDQPRNLNFVEIQRLDRMVGHAARRIGSRLTASVEQEPGSRQAMLTYLENIICAINSLLDQQTETTKYQPAAFSLFRRLCTGQTMSVRRVASQPSHRHVPLLGLTGTVQPCAP